MSTKSTNQSISQPASKSALETMLNHRSIRKFIEQAISETLVETLIQAGQMGSSSGFLQSASIIRVKNPDTRYQIRRICAQAQDAKPGDSYGHAYVESAPEFWVFCMDNHRHQTLVPSAQIDWTEVTLVGAIDAAIMAQNILVAAESLGLGGVYIGSVRNDINRLSELLQLPSGVVPLFGLCLGYPDQNPEPRPRLPASLVVSTDTYQPASQSALTSYNDTVKAYYQGSRQADTDWINQIQNYLDQPSRPEILPYLQQQGYAKH